jgi:hypothetical protein
MEVLSSEGTEGAEGGLVITRWQSRDAFDAWVGSLELSPHASTEELEHRYRKTKDPVERSHWQIVWLLGEGKTTGEVCEVTGYSPGWVRQIARRYNDRGVEGLGDRRHGNPGARERALLDEAGESELREALLEGHRQAGECGAGRRWRAG